LSLNDTILKINSIDYIVDNDKNQTLLISLSNTDKSLSNKDSCQDFIKNLKTIFEKNSNNSIKFQNFLLLNERIFKIELNDYCDMNLNRSEKFYSAANTTLFEDLEDFNGSSDDFLISVIVPSVIMGGMLFLAILLACLLHCSNKKKKRNARDNNPIYKQKSYLSKGVPVILYEEMTEKSIEEEDTLSGGHRMPLIMRNEKPPQPAPPEYRKQLSLQHLNDEQTINDIKNMLNNAPLASTEQVNDDTIPFLASNIDSNGMESSIRDDLLFYQPPQPILGIKDVSRRPHATTNQSHTTQFLP
jgi:hypothetical protein